MAAASTAVLSNSLNAAGLALRPFTVVRARGFAWCRSDQSVASEDFLASFGLCVVSDQAVDIGVTAVPTPEADRSSDLWFQYETLGQGFTFKDATGFVSSEGITKDWDSRAMRKVEEGQDMVMVKESASISGGLFLLTAGRLLVKLH